MTTEELLKNIHITEAYENTLFCTSKEINNHIIRYDDDQLSDMYDHNYFICDTLNEDDLLLLKEYKNKLNESHLKIESSNELTLLNNDSYFEKGVTLTMVKCDSFNVDKVFNNLTFKNLKDNNELIKDLSYLEYKHYAKVYGEDFTIRKNERIFNSIMNTKLNYNFYAAYYNNTIVSFISTASNDYIVGVDDLLVDEDYRHRGIASTFLKYIYELYNTPMYLHADLDDTPKDMYKKLGFNTIEYTYEYLHVDENN